MRLEYWSVMIKWHRSMGSIMSNEIGILEYHDKMALEHGKHHVKRDWNIGVS